MPRAVGQDVWPSLSGNEQARVMALLNRRATSSAELRAPLGVGAIRNVDQNGAIGNEQG